MPKVLKEWTVGGIDVLKQTVQKYKGQAHLHRGKGRAAQTPGTKEGAKSLTNKQDGKEDTTFRDTFRLR